MDVREKLVELLNKVQDYGTKNTCEEWSVTVECKDNEAIADHLIAHGVTVQEWISVKDRLPEESGLYITCGCTTGSVSGKEHPQYRFIEAGNITHWMPLPQPPKGE